MCHDSLSLPPSAHIRHKLSSSLFASLRSSPPPCDQPAAAAPALQNTKTRRTDGKTRGKEGGGWMRFFHHFSPFRSPPPRLVPFGKRRQKKAKGERGEKERKNVCFTRKRGLGWVSRGTYHSYPAIPPSFLRSCSTYVNGTLPPYSFVSITRSALFSPSLSPTLFLRGRKIIPHPGEGK